MRRPSVLCHLVLIAVSLASHSSRIVSFPCKRSHLPLRIVGRKMKYCATFTLYIQDWTTFWFIVLLFVLLWNRREQWPMFSTYSCWQLLLNQTKALSKDHATLSEIYTTHLVARLQSVIEDVQRIYKKCREVGYETHEEILRVLQELHTTMKTYQNYQVKWQRRAKHTFVAYYCV